MNKEGIAGRMAETTGMTHKAALQAVEAFAAVVTHALVNGEEASVVGFGTFCVRQRKGRKGVNPQNNAEIVDIPATVVPKFKAGVRLKEAVKANIPVE